MEPIFFQNKNGWQLCMFFLHTDKVLCWKFKLNLEAVALHIASNKQANKRIMEWT